MGMMICPTHGRVGILFVCPHISKAVETLRGCPEIERLGFRDPEIPEYDWACWFCPICIADHHLPASGSVIGDDFLDRTSSLFQPMCPACFRDWRDHLILENR
jgi:hypothetical protein